MGKFAEVLLMHENCLKLKKQKLVTLKLMGKYAEALPMYEDCLKLKKQKLGDDSPST
jgi:hypothetical protein